MSEDVRLYIVTDDPARACLAVIGCHLTELPPIFRIVTGSEQIAAIPNGAAASDTGSRGKSAVLRLLRWLGRNFARAPVIVVPSAWTTSSSS